MADEQDQGERTEEPSAYRIEEFRKRGEVASSKELTSVLVLSACIFTLGLSIIYIYEEMSAFVDWIYTKDIRKAFQEKELTKIIRNTIFTAFKCAIPVLAISFIVGVVSLVSQIGFLFAPEVLAIKFERINPVSGIKRLVSIRSLVEAIKGVFKFTIILFIAYFFVKDDFPSYVGFLHLDFLASFLQGKYIILKLSFAIIIGMFIVALGDLLYQKMSYKKKLMQTKEEVKKETKEQEGNPELKQRIRSIQREMANKRMMAEIPSADVIITNPTHISVVIKYDKESMVSPVLVGKGADLMALKIREIAKKHDVPIVENKPLARTIYSTLKIGELIPRNLYKAVAEVLAFVYKLKKKKKALN